MKVKEMIAESYYLRERRERMKNEDTYNNDLEARIREINESLERELGFRFEQLSSGQIAQAINSSGSVIQ